MVTPIPYIHTASKIRGTVAGIPFENFHKYSSEVIRAGVFGRDEHGKLRDRLVFSANNLVSESAVCQLSFCTILFCVKCTIMFMCMFTTMGHISNRLVKCEIPVAAT